MKADVAEQARGRAAQDYRASVARALRRQRVEQVVTCEECGTELDVAHPVHDRKCSRRPAEAATTANGGGAEMGAVWEKGRDGVRRSAKERTPDGSLTVGEMQRRHDTVLDAAPLTTLCGISECDWRYDGTAAEGRDQAAEHRKTAHPEWGKPKTKQRTVPRSAEPSAERGLDALLAMDAGAPQPVNENGNNSHPEIAVGEVSEPGPRAAVVDTDATPQDGNGPETVGERQGWQPGSLTSPPGGGKKRWTRDALIAAIQRWDREHGRPPRSTDWLRSGGPNHPAFGAVCLEFGTWNEGITAAGFVPISRGGQPLNENKLGKGKAAVLDAVLAEREPKADEALSSFPASPEADHGVSTATAEVGHPSPDPGSERPEDGSRSASTEPALTEPDQGRGESRSEATPVTASESSGSVNAAELALIEADRQKIDAYLTSQAAPAESESHSESNGGGHGGLHACADRRLHPRRPTRPRRSRVASRAGGGA